MPTHTEMMPQAHPLLDEESASVPEAAATEVSLLDIAVLLMQHKRFIARFVLGAAVLAAAIALVLPVTYEANIVLLPPAQSSSMA